MLLRKTAFMIFGKLVEPYLDYFDSLRLKLKKAGMTTTVHEYISAIILYSFICFTVSLIAGSFLISYVMPFMTRTISSYDAVYHYTLSVIISLLVAGGMFMLGYYYPSIKAKNKRNKIEKQMPFAVFYMATSSSSGINPVEIFRMLSQRGGIIGKEAERICNDVGSLGMDLSTSLQKAATRSPSPLFSDLLWNMSTIITTGGNLQKYLTSKTRTFMNQYRRNLDNYAKQIALYTEIYITLVIVGSLFFIVLLSIMSPMIGGGQFALLLQTFLVFFFIPLVSAGFIVLLKGIYPSE